MAEEIKDTTVEEITENTDEQQKKSEEGKKGFTQEEVDALIEKRLARERKKTEKEKTDAEADKNKSADQKAKEKADKEAKAQADKVTAMEAKLLCFEKDVAKDCISDVVALAKAYMDDDTDFETAIDKVLKKYPSFTKANKPEENEDEKPGTTGKKTKGSNKGTDGVEAAFLKRNPGLKL